MLESAPPSLLAEHLNPAVMWRCLKEAAERGGLSRKGGARNPSARQWFTSIVARALESELIAPADVVRFLPPGEFVAEAPKSVMAKLIETALSRGSFDPTLVLEHITPSVIAENLETSFVWDCIAEAAAKHFDLEAAPAAPRRRARAPRRWRRRQPRRSRSRRFAKAAKPIEREKPAIERKTAADKAAIAAAITGGAAAARPRLGSNPTTARGIPVAASPAPASHGGGRCRCCRGRGCAASPRGRRVGSDRRSRRARRPAGAVFALTSLRARRESFPSPLPIFALG